ncbi:hypothetical protein A0H81_03583 [Grifola frondosa]|uniref:Uncharacterized protein n=1 Tax=Grifola frondosa TaxID=5627 RepID=A0A1C7MH93_GRIFR|nr:hypothetical protein A0H81_03583 [Grifola frondosa]
MVPKAEYARGRRLLTPSNPRLPLAAVVMRGDAQFINQREKSHISRYSLPAIDETRHVEDVCLMGDNTVVVGYNVGPSQVSLIPLFDDQLPRRIDLRYKAHSTVIESKSHPAQPNPGISCLADPPRRVLSCAGPFIATTSLSAHSAPEPERVSGKIQQVHIHPHAPSLVVLEVDHMDRQVHFYDTRKGGFRHAPCLEFGHRTAARRAGTRYAKGSASNSLFARGYADGTVHVWDYRNGARKNVVERFQFERPAEVVHTVLCDSDWKCVHPHYEPGLTSSWKIWEHVDLWVSGVLTRVAAQIAQNSPGASWN